LFSFVLIIGGFYIEAPVGQIAGTAILFVTGLLLMFSSIEYVSGSATSITYVYDSGNLSSAHHTENVTFSSWDEEAVQGVQVKHTIAVLLLLSSILLFVSILSQLREGLGDE